MEKLCEIIPPRLMRVILSVPPTKRQLIQDIRLRRNSPLCVSVAGRCVFIGAAGNECSLHNAVTVFDSEVEECFLRACGYSVYSFEDEMRSGFLTVRGGHRIGVAATAVMKDGRISSVKDVSGLNIRLARQVRGCAESVMNSIVGDDTVRGTVIISEPCGGKTTMLRDVAATLSYKGIRVCVIDERGELCAVCDGEPMFDIGPCTDVLNMFPKAEGITRAVRTLSPSVIVTDEIGGDDDIQKMTEAMKCGVSFVFSSHASTAEELFSKKGFSALAECGCIKNIIELCGRQQPCSVKRIIKTDGKRYENCCTDTDNTFFGTVRSI